MSGHDQSWRDAAHRCMIEGRPDEALELYRDNYLAAKTLPSVTITRLSVWLSEWAQLAHTYPPAMEALRQLRGSAVSRLRGTQEVSELTGSGSLSEPSRGLAALDDFAEIAAISTRLDEPDFPIELFADLDAHQPQVAEDCAAQARRLLVRAGRFHLARRYLSDPLEVVARVAAVFDQRLTRGFAHAPEGLRATMRAHAVDDYLSNVREIIAVLDGVGEHELSERVRHEAVAAVPWAHVREDIATALVS